MAAVLACRPASPPPVAEPVERELSLDVLEDKIRGGWAGQMIGVVYGAPTEFQYLERLVPEESIPAWSPERVRDALGQDDLYVDITLAQVLDEHGLDATTEDFGALFREAEYSLWHANLAARRALRRGVPASESGTPRYNVHANDIDFQIEADFIGLMTPGLPRASNELCERAGRVMNHGDGLYGGMFVSAMYAAAFFEDKPRRIVEAGFAVLPPASPYARVIADVLAWSEEYPDDWTRVWELIDERWNDREPCSEGAQEAVPAPLELWDDYGSPVERVAADDPRFLWEGDWGPKTVRKWGAEFTSRASSTQGSSVTVPFLGTGVILVGWYLPTGGLADVFLDGELATTVDTYPDEDDVKFGESVWHAFGLADGEHELRLVVRGEPYVESQGPEICLTGLVVFR